MKKIIKCGLIAGIVLFVVSYGSLALSIQYFPSLYSDYVNPLFNSTDPIRDVLFYCHAFVISIALSWLWERFKPVFKGSFWIRGIEFGLVYTIVSLVPVYWITFSAIQDITVTMVLSWIFFGLVQSAIAGIIFAKLNP